MRKRDDDRDRDRQKGPMAQPEGMAEDPAPDGAELTNEQTTSKEQGDETRPAQPPGTQPLERAMWPKNQRR